jgi:multidrug resistance efflux pump
MARPFLRHVALGLALALVPTIAWAEDPPTPAPAESPTAGPAPAPAPAAEAAKPPAAAPTEEAEKPSPPPPEPECVTVERGRFSVVIELGSALEPVEPAEIAWRPQALGGEVEVLEVVKPGPVEAGQVLVVLKGRRQQEQVGLARLDLEINEANVLRLVEEDKRRERLVQIQHAGLKREAQRTADDLTRFLELERALRKSESTHGLKGAENGLQDSIEELAQLEKMYKGDDLTEETEDIVLKRSQRELERQKERLGFQRQRNDWFLAITLPRDQENLEHRALETRLELERFEATREHALGKAKAELKKAQQELELQRQAVGRMESDLLALILRAPKSGRVVPGVLVRGRWQGVEETQRLLKPGEKVRAEQVLLTLFEPGDLRVRAQVGEAQLFQLAEGAKGTLSPTAAEDLKLPVTLTWLSPAGVDGKHEALLSLDAGDPRLVPGLTGKLRLRAKERSGVITVPEAALAKEGDVTKVFVRADGVTQPRTVKVGASSEGRVEVTEGLEPGERVLVKAPAK